MSDFNFQDAVDQLILPHDRVKTYKLIYANTSAEVMAEVTFHASPGRDVISLFVYTDGTFTVGGSTTVTTEYFLAYTETYYRAFLFVKVAGLKPRL